MYLPPSFVFQCGNRSRHVPCRLCLRGSACDRSGRFRHQCVWPCRGLRRGAPSEVRASGWEDIHEVSLVFPEGRACFNEPTGWEMKDIGTITQTAAVPFPSVDVPSNAQATPPDR